jgi:hypothetical protein
MAKVLKCCRVAATILEVQATNPADTLLLLSLL